MPPQFPDRASRATSSPPWRELVVVCAIVATALALRGWRLSAAGLEHFDEGVYAFSALSLADPGQPHAMYPGQTRFSPPLYFAMIAFSFMALGPSDTAALIVNVLLGTFTVLALWWVGRAWFGPVAGVGAAAWLAVNDFHIALSRTALTDVGFALWFLLAVAALKWALDRQTIGPSLLAGLCTGLAWNTKYHGWFAVPLAAGAWAATWLTHRSPRPTMARSLVVLALAGLVATVCYVPWALLINSQPGGYAAMAAYQKGMLSPDWLGNLWTQILNQVYFDGKLSRAAVLVAIAAVSVVAGGGLSWRLGSLTVCLAAVSLVAGGAATGVLIAFMGVAARAVRSGGLAAWTLAGWMALWLASTPLYHPYARLVLPMTLATALGVGAALGHVLSAREANPARLAMPGILLAGILATVLYVLPLGPLGPAEPWRPTDGLRKVATSIETVVPRGTRVVVIGEPALGFYLHLAGRPAYERLESASTLATEPAPLYVATGLYATLAPSLRDGLHGLRGRLRTVGVYPFSPGDIRLLDDSRASAGERRNAHRGRHDIKLSILLPESHPNGPLERQPGRSPD